MNAIGDGLAEQYYWAEIERLRVIHDNLVLYGQEQAATIADLTAALRDAIETMKHANRDAFCNGVVHQGRDEGDVVAGQVIDRGLAALARAQKAAQK